MAKDKGSAVDLSQQIIWKYRKGQKNGGFPWGPHKLPLAFDLEGVSVVVEKRDDGFLYRREGAGESVEKMLFTDKNSLLFNPIEPLHKPSAISNHLLIDFEKAIVIEPRSNRDLLVTFPLEIACTVNHRQDERHILDIIAPGPAKFTLYGQIKDGLVCKYCKSAVYAVMPDVSPFEQGIMKVEIQNPGSRWAEVNKAVFSAFGMKIYYSPHLVSLNATMKISNEFTAETNFIDKPLKTGMSMAFEQFGSKLLSQMGRTVMEEGY